jgi:hypothetical protein
MSFPRHREIFPSDEDAGFAANVPAHRQDEFPAGYSLAVALQHGPLPLHQPGTVCCNVVLPVEIFSSNGQLCLNCLCQPRGKGKHLAIGAKVLFILAGLLGVIWGLDIFAIRHNSLGIVTIYRVWSRA